MPLATEVSPLTSSFGHLLDTWKLWPSSAGSSLAALLSGYCAASLSQMYGIYDPPARLPAHLRTEGRPKTDRFPRFPWNVVAED